jgi:arabinan endo-1,5-alpha-L-arabinosidase
MGWGVYVLTWKVVRPSIGYDASQFLFGWNYLDWEDGWPVLVDA